MPDRVRHDNLTLSLPARPAIHAPLTSTFTTPAWIPGQARHDTANQSMMLGSLLLPGLVQRLRKSLLQRLQRRLAGVEGLPCASSHLGLNLHRGGSPLLPVLSGLLQSEAHQLGLHGKQVTKLRRRAQPLGGLVVLGRSAMCGLLLDLPHGFRAAVQGGRGAAHHLELPAWQVGKYIHRRPCAGLCVIVRRRSGIS